MAMRQQPRISTVSSTLPRPVGRLVSETFEPFSETKEELDAHVLLIRLPGFTKDRVRITYVHSSRIVRVTGDRPIGNVRWSRFNQAFPVPETCDVEKIHAKFEHGVLSIKMPKKVPTVPLLKQEAPTTPSTSTNAGPEKVQKVPLPKQEAPTTPSTSTNAEPAKVQKAASPPKSASTITATAPSKPAPVPKQEKTHEVRTPLKPTVTTAAPSSSPQKPLAAKEETGSEERTQKPSSPINGRRKETEVKKEEGLLPPKAVVETKPSNGDQDQTPQKPGLVNQVNQKIEEVRSDSRGKVREVKEAEKAYRAESSLSKKPVENAMVTEKETKEESKVSGLPGFASVSNKGKQIKDAATDLDDERKPQEEMSYTMGKRVKEMTASAKEAVTRMAKQLNDEDKQLLINMGAAILVIAALGAYVTYRISSSGKSEK